MARIDRTALPPGPRIAALQSARYLSDPCGYTRKLRERYGDLFSMPTLNGMLVMACSPEGARQILAGREEDFVVGFGTDAIAPIVGDASLLLLSGERHKRERKLLSPTFHGQRMRAYSSAMQDAALRGAKEWAPGRRLVMRDEMERIALDVILRVVLGARDEAEVQSLARAIRKAVVEVDPLPLFMPFLQREFFGLGPWAKFQANLRELDAQIHALIARARSGKTDGKDVLSRLTEASYEDGAPMSDQAIRAELLTLLVAGHETTATAMAWMFYELGRHPEVAHRLREEIAGLGLAPEPDALAGIPILDAFCRETLRLHPIVAEFFRTVAPGNRFAIGGYEIPEGISLAGSILELHRDPELYPQPEQFRPERFMERQFAPHEFAAFGGSHRHCLGAAFALQQMKIVLGTLLPRFTLELTSPEPPKTVVRNLTLGARDGIPMRVAG